jgi:hypothetical protein
LSELGGGGQSRRACADDDDVGPPCIGPRRAIPP